MFELFGFSIDLSEDKIKANEIKKKFLDISLFWEEEINGNFYQMFSDLNDVYENARHVADKCREQSINEAMGFLVKYGIYDFSEKKFYNDFVLPFESWDEDFFGVSGKFEAIAERAASLDAYRTARRLNRRKVIGYGSRQAIYEADAENRISNIGHGVFNLIAKGMSEIEDSAKREEIFKDQSTVACVSNAVGNTAGSVFFGFG